MDFYTLVFGSIFALSLLYILRSRGSKKLPPGPSPWPVIGSLHLLGAKPHISLSQLAQIYGPIMSLRLGQITAVVISSSVMAKQVLQKQDLAFSNRFIPDALLVHNHHKSSDENQHLRSQKVKELVSYCAKCSQDSKVVDVGQAAFRTTLNLLSNTLFSKDLADPFSDSKVDLNNVFDTRTPCFDCFFMDYYTFVFGSILACGFLYILLKKIRSKKLPLGSTPWPIIGNIHLLGAKPHVSLAQLAQIYGPIMSLRLRQVTTVVISSSAMAKQILQKQDLAFSTRFIPDAVRSNNHYKFSVAWLPVCPQWQTLRRILNTNILSSNRLDANQHLRSEKVKDLVAYCVKCSQDAEVVDIGQAAFKTNLNFLSNTLFSKDLADPFSDSKVELKDVIWSLMAEAGKPNDATRHSSKPFTRSQARELQQLHAMFTQMGLIGQVLEVPEQDIIAAGTETTTNTLEWAMTEILRQPEIMKKTQAELAVVIGKGKPVEEAVVSRLPYLQCIIKETFRLHPSVPFLVPRKVERDVEVCGYIVPKGSQVLVNVWAIGRDSTYWEDPLMFKPERFWNLDLDVQGQDFELIPFGAGRRICPGLPLALRMVPVVLGSLLNSFNWKLETCIEPEELDMEEKFGLALAKAHPLRAIPSHLLFDVSI